ncbi:type A von Willebrand factor domain-containing protein [Cavenderia fasciculata]|uniref:26S proteasome regulatory subunit RPN10 n=1 Tax=Cavenderia fasciculata TaxID=261658 RepID=F4PSS9_CACFS|nr:type A von Willebrand factor domain-containing protein [Cavenderia fasciculata]EGG21557.1 type A von Willebrand factor domain-containing protein [Cavenderia fasciculata]|eukprot:XP_004359407.1 type A von Willebrand factor domain-containing protein [Cavenderia fasciculata]
MTLEAAIVCVDNSEWMRNSDFEPSRYLAQKDAVNIICSSKTHGNPETSVAILSMSGRPEILVTLTQDLSKVLASYDDIKIHGKIDFSTSMQIAQLALRHRQNKHQHPRIVAFVGSPLKETKEELCDLAKRLKKNAIAVDIINFGEETTNVEKLEAFISDVNNNDEPSHLLTVPAGPQILSDIIIQSKTIIEGSSTYGAEFINADTDPELAMALKLSLEEEKQRVERDRKARGETTESDNKTEESKDVQMGNMGGDNFDDDPDLQAALAMSLQQDVPMSDSSNTTTTTSSNNESSQPQQQQNSDAFRDQEFLNSTLMSLPGVDPNDERIKNVLENLSKKDENKKDGDKKEDK